MRILHYLTLLFVLCYCNTQAQKQSAIYDAATIMNSRYGVEALLIPNAAGFDIVDPVYGFRQTNVTATPDSFRTRGKAQDIIYEILRRNAGLPPGTTTAQINAAYSSNPFLRTLFSDPVAPGFTASEIGQMGNYIAPATSGGFGQDILGNLVNGTGDFLIKRANDEISIHVFQRLQKFVANYPEFETLFPNTCALLKPIEAYEYNKALVAFKAATKEDMQGFISKIPQLYNIPRYKLLNEKVPALTLFFCGATMIDQIHGKHGIAESIYSLENQAYLKEQNNYASFLQMVSRLSNSMLDISLADEEGKQPQYVHKEFIKHATHNYDPGLVAMLTKIYLGLLWQQTKDIPFVVNGTKENFGTLIEHWAGVGNISQALVKIERTIAALQNVDIELKTLKEEEATLRNMLGKTEMKAKRFTCYSKMIGTLLQLSELYLSSPKPGAATRIREINQFLPDFTDASIGMVKNFYEEEYNLGIAKLERVLTIVLDYLEKSEAKKDEATQLHQDFTTGLHAQKVLLENEKRTLQARIAALNLNEPDVQLRTANRSEKQELEKRITILDLSLSQVEHQLKKNSKALYNLPKVIRYINLLAAITKAENSAAVEALLETYALPAGSSRIKKVSSFNVAVNAYVGGFFLRSNTLGEGFTNTYGLTAPIGITISKGWQRWGSLSLFAGVFDIGGTIRYKLDNNGKYQQDISLAGIVSPGVHVAYGFPWYVPLSLGIGSQWLSPTSTVSNKINLQPSFNMFIGVDIPLFNLTGIKKK